jgi:GT2 family glycosyltransferase
VRPDGTQQPSAWRFPSPRTALLTMLGLEDRLVVQSRGDHVRGVDWARSAALLVRREAAAEIGWFDPEFSSCSDEVDFCKRLRDAGWRTLYVPAARAAHHEELSTGSVRTQILELARTRDRYMRKHHSAAAALAVRLLTAAAYAMRTLGALVTPGRDAGRCARQASAALFPSRGERPTAER